MKINIDGMGLDLTPSLKTYIDRKLGGLARFLGKYEGAGEQELRLRLARTTRHHHRGEVFRAEATIGLPGRVLRAVEGAVDARAAVDAVARTLKMEIGKYKTRLADRRRSARST